MSSAPPSRPPELALLLTLIYELLDAHRDTLELTIGPPSPIDDDLGTGALRDDAWRAHLDYLRALQRRGRELLAKADAANGTRPAEAMP